MAIVTVFTDDGQQIWQKRGVRPRHVQARLGGRGPVARELAEGITRAVVASERGAYSGAMLDPDWSPERGRTHVAAILEGGR